MAAIFSHAKRYVKWYVLTFLCTVSICLWVVVIHENRHGVLTFAVLNVGQGDALYIESPTGTQVIVDGGPNKNLLPEIQRVMPWYDRSVDMIVVTNPDMDHYSGFISFLEQYSAETVLEAGTVGAAPAYKVLEKEIADKKMRRVVAERGQVIDLGGGAYLQVLFPDRDASLMSSNDGSLVMRLVYGDTSVILQGDSTARIEQYLLSRDGGSASVPAGNHLRSTILKAGHHGSKTSSDPDYVRAVAPEWAVVSSGIDNTYNHPNQETLDTFHSQNIPALDTCVMGRIVFHSDGKIFTLENKIIPVEAGCKSK